MFGIPLMLQDLAGFADTVYGFLVFKELRVPFEVWTRVCSRCGRAPNHRSRCGCMPRPNRPLLLGEAVSQGLERIYSHMIDNVSHARQEDVDWSPLKKKVILEL